MGLLKKIFNLFAGAIIIYLVSNSTVILVYYFGGGLGYSLSEAFRDFGDLFINGCFMGCPPIPPTYFWFLFSLIVSYLFCVRNKLYKKRTVIVFCVFIILLLLTAYVVEKPTSYILSLVLVFFFGFLPNINHNLFRNSNQHL